MYELLAILSANFASTHWQSCYPASSYNKKFSENSCQIQYWNENFHSQYQYNVTNSLIQQLQLLFSSIYCMFINIYNFQLKLPPNSILENFLGEGGEGSSSSGHLCNLCAPDNLRSTTGLLCTNSHLMYLHNIMYNLCTQACTHIYVYVHTCTHIYMQMYTHCYGTTENQH